MEVNVAYWQHDSEYLFRKGYIAPRHEDDYQSGCLVTDDELCQVCGDSREAGDVVKGYHDGDIIEITVQLKESGQTIVNQFRICPKIGDETYSN